MILYSAECATQVALDGIQCLGESLTAGQSQAQCQSIPSAFPPSALKSGTESDLWLFLCGRRERLHQRLPHGALPARRQALRDRGRHQRGAQARHRQGLQRHLQVTPLAQGQRRHHHEALTARLERTTRLFLPAIPSSSLVESPPPALGTDAAGLGLDKMNQRVHGRRSVFSSFVIILIRGVRELLILSFARQFHPPTRQAGKGVCSHSCTQKVNPNPPKWTMREQLCSFQKALSAIKQLEFSILPLEGETSCCDLPMGLIPSVLGT